MLSVPFDPCPGQDFNVAGFLSFAGFLAFVDRAGWVSARDLAISATTARRGIVFRGNVDRGETVRVALIASRSCAGGIEHHCAVHRGSDDAVVADVFSRRVVAERLHRQPPALRHIAAP